MATLPSPTADASPGPVRSLPPVVQGGMGVAVSGWRLARAVSSAGQLGVVSGTAMDTVLARTLQDGDPGGHYRRALAHLFLEDGELAQQGARPVGQQLARIGQAHAALRTGEKLRLHFVFERGDVA